MRAGLLVLTLTAIALLPSPATAAAERVEGVLFEHARRVDDNAWLLSGTHVSRWAGLLKVGVSALWLSPDARGRDALDPRLGKQLEIHYLVPIAGERLRGGTREVMARNAPADLLARERAAIEAIVSAFGDVRAGDRYTLTHRPGRGVWLALNGNTVAHTAREEAAVPLFAVWLGAKPLDAGQKHALLALRRHPPGSDRASAAHAGTPAGHRIP